MSEGTLAVGELVDAAAVASYLGVARSYVYEHAAELGARRLGRGPRARLRFSLTEVDERLRERATCIESRRSEGDVSTATTPIRRRRRGRDLGTRVELLPIRGIRSRRADWRSSGGPRRSDGP